MAQPIDFANTVGNIVVTPVWPCDRGTGRPVGYHQYAANQHGTCCIYCGKNPTI